MSRARSRSGYMASSSYLGSSSPYLGETGNYSSSSYYPPLTSSSASAFGLLNSPTYSSVGLSSYANGGGGLGAATSSYGIKSNRYGFNSAYRLGGDDFLYDSLKSSLPLVDSFKTSSPRLYRSTRSHPELPITEVTPPTPASPRESPAHLSLLNGYSATSSSARPIKDFDGPARSRSLDPPEYGRYYYRDTNASNDYQQHFHEPPSSSKGAAYPVSMMNEKPYSSTSYFDTAPPLLPPSNAAGVYSSRPFRPAPTYRISDAYRDPPSPIRSYRDECSESSSPHHHHHHHHHSTRHSRYDCEGCSGGVCKEGGSGRGGSKGGASSRGRCREESPYRKTTTTSCSHEETSCNKRSSCNESRKSPSPPPSVTCNHEPDDNNQGLCSSSKASRKGSTLIRESTHKQHENASAPPPPKERSVVLSFEKYQSPYATINRVANMTAAEDSDEEVETTMMRPGSKVGAVRSGGGGLLRSNRASGFRTDGKLKVVPSGGGAFSSKRDRRKTLAYGVSARDLLTTSKACPPGSRILIPKLEHYDLALQKDSYEYLNDEGCLLDSDIAFRTLSPEVALATASLKQQPHQNPSLTLASLEREVNGLKVAAQEDEKLIVLRKDDLNSLLTAKPTLLIGKELNISGDVTKSCSSSGGAGASSSASNNKFLHPHNAQQFSAGSSSGYHKSMDKDSHNGDIDYKKLWEESQMENSRLREELSKSEDTRGRLEGALNSASKPQISEAEKREKRALEKKLSEMEEELKQIEHLKNEIQRLRDENGALIRVISKLSK